jgi:hypothetical protein
MSMSNGRDTGQGRGRNAASPAGYGTQSGAMRPAPERRRPPMPVIHQIAWVSLFMQLLIVGILIAVATYYGSTMPILTGTIAYLVLATLIRLLLTSHQRRGMYYARAGRLELAIPEFQKSYEFFHRHPWLDELRYIFLLSTSRVSYREMGLLNLAYCDLWADRGDDAVRTYLRTIEEFPNSGLAWTGIKLFQQGGYDGERRAAASIAAGRLPPSVAAQGTQADVSIREAR